MRGFILVLSCAALIFFSLSVPQARAAYDTAGLAAKITQDEQGYSLIFSDELVKVESHWPALGKKPIDDDSQAFIMAIVQAFIKDAEEMAADYKKEKELGNELMNYFPLELNINYELSAFCPRSASIAWNIWRFTGGAHGQLDIVANIYDLEKDHPVLLEDLVIDPNTALLTFTKISREKLSASSEEDKGDDSFVDEMLMAGTEPDPENFRAITLTPDGIRINFQPYQVAPWSAGPQTVEVTLQELEKAQPRLEFWCKK